MCKSVLILFINKLVGESFDCGANTCCLFTCSSPSSGVPLSWPLGALRRTWVLKADMRRFRNFKIWWFLMTLCYWRKSCKLPLYCFSSSPRIKERLSCLCDAVNLVLSGIWTSWFQISQQADPPPLSLFLPIAPSLSYSLSLLAVWIYSHMIIKRL